jgi:galactokinase
VSGAPPVPADAASRLDALRSAFTDRYGRPPTVVVRAPGRVDAMGSHTDYNEGFVLTLPIDLDTWIAAAPREDDRIRLASLNADATGELSLAGAGRFRAGDWLVYPHAVATVLADEGFALTACDVLVHGTLPLASGLSSSASLEAATAVLLATLGGHAIEPVRMARLCQRAENEIVGVPCGILDQYTSILGRAGSALLLDCRHLRHEHVALPRDLRVVVCDTRAPRRLGGSAYGERRASCEAGVRALAARLSGVTALRDVTPAELSAHADALDPTTRARCRFVVEENARVHALAAALRDADREAIGALCDASFRGARDLYAITVPAMEAMIEAMRGAPGVVGARQAGAGFGGCTMAFVEAERVDAFASRAAAAYERTTGTRPGIHAVRIAAGAGVLEGP